MLRLTHFNPTGFYSFGKCGTVNLDNNGLIFLNGRNEDEGDNPNGAGKSNFLRALARILIGEDGTKIKVAEAVNDVWKKGAWGFVQFDIEGEEFRIIEARSWPKSAKYPVDKAILKESHLETLGETYSGTGLYFEKWDGQMWRDMRVGKRMEHTRALILDKIGMDYDGFCSTSYLAQRRGLKILEAKPKERFSLISPLADLEFWNKVGKLVHKELNWMTVEIAKTMAVIKEIEQQITTINQIPDNVFAEQQKQADDQEALIDKWNAELEILRTKLSTIAGSYSKEEVELRGQLAKVQAEHDNIAYVQPKEVTGLKEAINNHNRAILNIRNYEVDQISQVEQSIPDADVSAASMDIEELQASINHKQKLLKDANTEAGICWFCGSEVTKGHVDKHTQQLEKEIQECSVDLKRAQDKCDNLLQQRSNRIKSAKDKIKADNKVKIDEFNKLIEAAEIQIKELELKATQASLMTKGIKSSEINKLKENLANFPTPEDRAKESEDVKPQITTLENQVGVAQRSKADALAAIKSGRKHNEDQAKKLSSLMGRIGQLQAELAQNGDKKELYNSLEKEFGRAGIQAFEIGTLLDEFNHYLSNFIWVLTDGMLKVELSPYKEKKKAKHAFDHIAEITARVSDSYKQNTPLELYCGCETQQIVVAMLFAFRTLAMTRGAGTNIIALDEIDRSMSPYNTDRLVSLLDTVRKSIPTMFVISHNERTKNTMPADSVWTAVRKNGISHLEI